MTRHPKTVMREWRRWHNAGVQVDRVVPDDPTAYRHHRQVVVVLPHGTNWDEEYGQIARQVAAGWGWTCHGARPDGTPSRWHERADHRSVEHWRHVRTYDNGDEPTLLVEDVVIDRVLRPTFAVRLGTTGRPLVPLPDRLPGESDEDYAARWTWTGLASPASLRVTPDEGDDGSDAELLVDGAELSAVRVAVRPGEWTEVPTRPDSAVFRLPMGRQRLLVQAVGSGTPEGVTLSLGRLVLVERHRKYHRVSPAVDPE